jgi:hypothetical protein
MVAISLVLLVPGSLFTWTWRIGGQSLDLNLLDIPVTLAGIFTLVSGIGYLTTGIRQFQAGGHANN